MFNPIDHRRTLAGARLAAHPLTQQQHVALHDRAQASSKLELPHAPGALPSVRVAPPQVSAIACPKCDRYQPRNWPIREGQHMLTCYNCEFTHSMQRFRVDLQPGQEQLLADAAVRSRNWYHVSTKTNWLATVQRVRNSVGGTPMVHLGSREAALDRLLDIQRRSIPIHLYEVRLRAGADIAPGFFKDKDRWPKYSTDALANDRFQGYSTAGVTRYVNHYEGCGTISLLANAACLELVSHEMVTGATTAGF